MKKLILFILTIFIQISYCAQQNEPTGSKRKPELDIEKNRAQKRQKTEQVADEIEKIRLLFVNLLELKDNQLINQQIEKIKEQFRKSGVDVDVNLLFRGFYETPLHIIARYKQFNPLAKWLIEQGADSTKIDEIYLLSPFSIATESCNYDLLGFMISHGADFSKPNFLFHLSLVFHLENYYRDSTYQDRMIRYKNILKTVLINGANFKEEIFQKYIKANNDIKKAFDEVVQEIVNEYRKKINDRNNAIIAQLDTELSEKQKHTNIMAIFKEYLIPTNYTDEQIMVNIMQIRYDLGELSDIQKAKFEEQIRQKQQNQQARPAEDSVMHLAQQAAASTDIASMQQ